MLYVDSWARHRIYAAFKDVLGSGMHHHLQVGGWAERAPQFGCFGVDWIYLPSLSPEQ